MPRPDVESIAKQGARVSTRAIIAYRKHDGTWTGVWNHWSGHPQHLGKALIERIAVMDGDLPRFARQFIDRCPEGWSDFAEGQRTEDGGLWTGRCTGSTVTFDKLPDAHLLYLLDPSERRLEIYEVKSGKSTSFDVVSFDELGKAAPGEFKALDM